LRQERWASSEEFERGLLGNLVARRCVALNDSEGRRLVYFLQALSHREGSLERVAAELLTMFPERVGTASMHRFGMKPGQVYSANQVKAIRQEVKVQANSRPEWDWPLRGDKSRMAEYLPDYGGRDVEDKAPESYQAEEFTAACQAAARGLAEHLEEFCLNPALKMDNASPWYFPALLDSLWEYQTVFAEKERAGTVVTEIGAQIYDTLDYALEAKCMVLIEGLARMGKTFAAKAWCSERPGQARYVQVPSTNDDVGFFRAIAKALGVSCGRSWKAVQLRQRIEDTLQTGDLILVMDEAHYLWPVSDCRHALPGRINWVMTALVNHGVGCALVTTPQFIATQKAVEKRTHWTSEQFIGRIGHYLPLPKSLGEDDLAKVAKALLPAGDAKSIEILVRYAQNSAKYLAGIETAVRRARYLAKKDNRERVERADIKRAIQEAVIPSDSALAQALAEPLKGSRKCAALPLQGRLMESAEQANQAGASAAPRPDFAGIEPAGITGRNRLNSPRIARELVPA
jgi:DNA transposition AAA+ family ATPase